MTQADRIWRQWTFADKTAADALALGAEVLKDRIKCGFTYTSETCRFCVFEPGTQPGCVGLLMGRSGKAASLQECDHNGELAPVDLSVVFQLCLFGKDLELRWERMDGGNGRLTVSTDDASAALPAEKLAEFGGDFVREREVRCRDDQVYLLWGKRADGPAPSGWTRLTSARIGALWVPFEADGERIVLTAREYFETKAMGNVAFVGERLIDFRSARDEDAKLAGVEQ